MAVPTPMMLPVPMVAESAVHSISAIMLQNHLETCVVEQIEQGNTQIIDEAMQLIKKFAR